MKKLLFIFSMLIFFSGTANALDSKINFSSIKNSSGENISYNFGYSDSCDNIYSYHYPGKQQLNVGQIIEINEELVNKCWRFLVYTNTGTAQIALDFWLYSDDFSGIQSLKVGSIRPGVDLTFPSEGKSVQDIHSNGNRTIFTWDTNQGGEEPHLNLILQKNLLAK